MEQVVRACTSPEHLDRTEPRITLLCFEKHDDKKAVVLNLGIRNKSYDDVQMSHYDAKFRFLLFWRIV